MLDVLVQMQQEINRLQARLDELETREQPAIACRVYKSTDFTHNSTGNFLAVGMPDERWDTYGMHSATPNPERITVSIGGWYYIWGGIVFAANATGSRILEIRVDGSTVISRVRDNTPSASLATALVAETIYYLSASSYVSIYAYQNSGGNLAIISLGNYSPELAVMRLP